MFTGLPYFRDLPYSWSTLVENLVDPSHLNFSHHGVIGDRCGPLSRCYQIPYTAHFHIQSRALL